MRYTIDNSISAKNQIPLMLSVKEVAAMAGVSERTITRQTDAGKFPASVYMGARRLWHGPTVADFLRTCVITSSPDRAN